ncbi:NAD(P)/FAD-dependent oxidoreductase [Sphingoaurantiacus capsulatus]|uniref:NAD(P)/FAD-dependent oxidoreductase n=1 Tax=Sphingoaurantiacus capsulatus TaxID=1771310 RepID=A0ABV7X9K2_9SPHN
MSTRFDVIVIGGGIAGCATAHYLARDGVSVALLEAGELNAFASGANAGSLHAQIPHDPFVHKGENWARAFTPAVQLFKASLDIWTGLEAELGADLEIGVGGGLLVGANDVEMRQIEAKARIERDAGLEIEMLDRAAIRERAPYLSTNAIGGAFCPSEGKANPLVVAPAFAAAARAHGAHIVSNAGEARVARTGDGYEAAAAGQLFAAPRLVIAAGIETGKLVESLGGSIEIQGFPIQANVTEPAEKFLPHLVYCAGEKLTMKQTRIGTVLIGGGWPAKLDARGRPVADPASLAANLAVAKSVVPAVGALQIVRTWAAIVNGTEDWLPILGELPGAPGAFINYVPWMGFTGGPAAALAIAKMVQGQRPDMGFDLAAFAPQ